MNMHRVHGHIYNVDISSTVLNYVFPVVYISFAGYKLVEKDGFYILYDSWHIRDSHHGNNSCSYFERAKIPMLSNKIIDLYAVQNVQDSLMSLPLEKNNITTLVVALNNQNYIKSSQM